MTWHKPVFAHRVLCTTFSVLLIACGSSSKNASITITAPEKGQVLTSKDDTDKDESGLQYTVTAASTDVAPGTDVILRIEGEKDAPLTKVGRDGQIEFSDVTLPRGKHAIKVQTGNGGIQSADDWDYTHKALVIESPKDGRVFSSESDDKDPDIEGVQVNVSVTTFAIDMTEDVVLQVDKEPAGTPLHPNGSENLTFTGVTLSNGSHTLKAVAGAVESDPVRITVNPTCANINFIEPKVPTDGSAVELGGGDMCPDEGEQFKTNFMVSTDAGDGRNVDLYVNGTLAANAKVAGTVVTFNDVVLDRYNTANEVEVVVETAQNAKCDPVKYPVDINLDCEGVDCSISAPKPVAGNNVDGDRVQYLNSSHKSGDGFDFEVHTDMQAVGRKVKLIVDGRETDAPESDPSGSDPNVKALFKGIKIADGEHTIAARCEHESGTFGLSRTSTWILDTQACGVDIQQPTADMLFVPGLDEDDNLSGVQVELESNLTGDDCRRARTAPCDPGQGIADEVGYEDVDGKSPLRRLVTLANEAEQDLCIDVLDLAGNKGSDHVAVRFRPEAPKLMIESPSDGAKYNAQGGAGYVQDTDTGSATVCNAHFDVACSELGSSVKLHRDDANGTVFGMATCEAKGNGDPELPDGYAGRARIRNAAFLSGNNDTVTVVATQSAGSSDLVGESPAITLKGDCEAPALTFTGDSPCEMGQIGVPDESGTVTKNVVVADSTVDTQNATLTVTSGNNVSFMKDAAVSSGSYTFSSSELGGPGTGKRNITVTVTAKDEFDNTGRVSCDTAIVFDLPVLMVMTPADNAFFTTAPTFSPEICVPTAGGDGLSIVATADVAANRTAAVSVNGEPDIALTLNNTSITSCVPIKAGPNELVFKLVSTRTTATAEVKRKINLVTAVPSNGITLNPATLPSDRNGKVTFSWTLPEEQFAGQFVGYQLRCGTRPYDVGTAEVWWTQARTVELPADFKPPTNTVQLDMRVGEDANCMLRAVDAANQLTPLTQSISVNLKFREARFTGPIADGAMGESFTGVGDINGDGVSDLLVGGWGRSFLVFGNKDGWSNPTPDVTFTGGAATDSYLGNRVAALGDFNGDGRPDFAIAESRKTGATPLRAGRVHVFFGRLSGDTWPSNIDMTSPTTCAADICFVASTDLGRFGYSLGSAGDFDGDGTPDLGVGAASFPVSGVAVGRMYVLLGGSSYTGTSRSGTFFGVNVPVESGAARRGFVFTGTGPMRLGASFASVGSFDSVAGGDLVIGAQGDSSNAPGGAIYFASGRSYMGSELVELPVGQLGFRDGGGTPSGQPIDTGANTFGAGVYALGNAYRTPGSAKPDAVDIGVYITGDTGFTLYPGDTNFAPADKVRVAQSGGGATYFGTSVCTGADLNGDGLTEMCAAGVLDLVTSTSPGTAYLWYGDNVPLQISGTSPNLNVGTDAASLINPPVAGVVDSTPTFVQAGLRVVDFVGDLNADGKIDMTVASPSSNDSAGEITILY
ncbi:MAG TPA: VCBS repeat-containing protein [Polyangiales bacterium]|nr:VCBS repeat-containing protein [Polyangiales bacterium]